MASVRTRSFSHPLPGDWIMSNLQRIGRDAAAPIQICLASTTLTAMLARRGQLEVVVMPPAAWSAREIEQALATLAALAQIFPHPAFTKTLSSEWRWKGSPHRLPLIS
jgi:hypothetical protein